MQSHGECRKSPGSPSTPTLPDSTEQMPDPPRHGIRRGQDPALSLHLFSASSPHTHTSWHHTCRWRPGVAISQHFRGQGEAERFLRLVALPPAAAQLFAEELSSGERVRLSCRRYIHQHLNHHPPHHCQHQRLHPPPQTRTAQPQPALAGTSRARLGARRSLRCRGRSRAARTIR